MIIASLLLSNPQVCRELVTRIPGSMFGDDLKFVILRNVQVFNNRVVDNLANFGAIFCRFPVGTSIRTSGMGVLLLFLDSLQSRSEEI